MNWTDAAQVTTVVTFIGALCTGLGVVLKTLFDSYMRYKDDARKDTKYEDEKTKDGYQIVIADMRARIQNLETVAVKRDAEHVECLKTSEGLRVQTTWQQRQLDDQRKLIDAMEAKLQAAASVQSRRKNTGE